MRHHGISVQFPLLSSAILLLASGWIAAAPARPPRAGAAAELRSERWIGPGVKVTTLFRPAGPWVIRVMEADGESSYVQPGLTFASERGLRAAPVSAQAARATQAARYPIAGVNGDFFAETPGPFEAEPVGALVIGGEVIHTPYPRSAFLIGPGGRYAIRRLKLAAWVEREGGPAQEPAHETDRARMALKAVNQPCGANDLVLYTPRFGLSTHTKAPMSEVTLTGMALPVRLGVTYQGQVAAAQSTGDMSIPAAGVVLAGRGAAATFLSELRMGDAVQFRLDFDPPVAADTDVVGGGPTLVRDGRVVVTEDTEGFKPDVVSGRAPRTAIGFNGRRVILVTVDGREPGVSAGMSLIELAALMRELGCTDAMNLDGGGSTTAWVRGSVTNRPSAGQERRVAEGLFLFSTAPLGPPVRLTVTPEEISILAGASCPLTLTGEDEYFNPVPAPAGPPAWQVDPGLGVVDASPGPHPLSPSPNPGGGGQGGTFIAHRTPVPGGEGIQPDLSRATLVPPPPVTGGGEQGAGASLPTPCAGTIRVQAGVLAGSVAVRVYTRPPRLVVRPAGAVVPPGGSRQFAVRAQDERGRPLITDGVAALWSCPPNLGTVDETGLFRAAAAPARGELTVEIAGTRASVTITVGTQTRLLDGFEVAGRWSGSTTPAVTGTVSLVDAAPFEGRHSLRLEYDFRSRQGTRAVYADTKLPLGQPSALHLWVRGNGGGAWLRARLRDGRGQPVFLDFARHLGRLETWQELTAPIPPGLPGPLTLEALYLVETDPQAQPAGSIDLDALAGEYAIAAGA